MYVFLDNVSCLQYITENKHKCFIDADTLVNTLRCKYPEYMRKQKSSVKYLAGRGMS